MKMLKIKFIVLLIMFPLILSAQLDCSDFFKYRTPTPPYRYNALSKSAVCLTGNKYEFIVPLNVGSDYRISFYASPVFNNQVEFKIIDQSSGQVVMSLPGESEDGVKGSCVLKPYFDEKANKLVHPYFDFFPATATSLKIIIDVKPLAAETSPTTGYSVQTPREKGCVTVLILDKSAENTGFTN